MNRMTVVVAMLLAHLLVGVAAAQQTDAPVHSDAGTKVAAAIEGASPELVGPRAAELFSRLGRIVTDSRRYTDMMAGASAEDSLVLRLQFEGTQDRFVTVMRQLAALVPVPPEQPALQDILVAIHRDLMPNIWQRIANLRREIDGLRARRSGIAPADLASLEARITHVTSRLDLTIQYAEEHIEVLARLGQDNSPERADFRTILLQRGDELSGRLELGLVRVNQLNDLLKIKPGDADLLHRLAAAKVELDLNTISMKTVLEIMDSQGIPNQELRTQFIGITQDLASGIMDVRVTATLARKAWLELSTWLAEKGPTYVLRVLVVLLIMLGGWLVSRLVRKAVEKSLDKAKLNISQLLKRTIVSFTQNMVLGLTVMMALGQFGISLGPMLAGLGVVGFILGFAMQDSLSNFAAGLMILFYRPYDVGDLVEIGSVFGKVEHMSMVSTSVLTLDNQKLVVPNSKIWGDVIKNVTDQRIRRVDMVFGISYSDDIPHAEKVLIDILTQHELVLDHPEPMVRLHALNESSVDFIVRPWVKTADYWDVYWAVTREVKMRFDAENISIPFPQRDVHLHGGKKGEAAE
jgi:small conductance mechanosensitive channel